MRAALSMETLKGIYADIASRYDIQHGLLTARADQRGRQMLVTRTVNKGDNVLDCGAGTGSTAMMAARMVGTDGHVTLFDLSEEMLAVARGKLQKAGFQDRSLCQTGDMVHMPFDDDSFDVVLSTYSLCPLYDPERGALELYRVTKPGGRLGIAHSTDPDNAWIRWLADRVEDVAWHMPWLSMGCRSVNVLEPLKRMGGEVTFCKKIGVPLWPFLVFIIEKPKA